MSGYFYKQPKYYDKFRCIGGACPETCCSKWAIHWKKEEVEKLQNAECSTYLKFRINYFFEPVDEEKYKIVLHPETKRCPFLDDENLCSIQKELGEEYLSMVCSMYPRRLNKCKNIFIRVCGSSCYAALKLICDEEDSMDMVMKEVKDKIVESKVTSEKEYMNHPELNYQNEIFDFFYEILSAKDREISTSIVLGALAAKKISELAENGKADVIPEALNKLRPQMNNKAQIESINKMEKNYIFSLGVVNEILNKLYGHDMFKVLRTDGKPDIDKCAAGMKRFNEAYKDKPYVLRNLILNYFADFFSYSYDPDKKTIYDNYLYFSFVAAAVNLSAAAVGYVCKDNEEIVKEFIEYQAAFARKIANDIKALDNTIKYLKEHKWNTPAYIALMVK